MMLSAKTRDPAPAAGRRRIAAWLIMAWAASWLLTLLQPCCPGISGTAYFEATLAIAHPAAPAGVPPLNGERDPLCDTFVSQQLVSQDSTLPLPGRAKARAWTESFAYVATIDGAPEARAAWADPMPPPRVHVYLRNSRILI